MCCVAPPQDLILPSFKPPQHYEHSQYMGRKAVPRESLLFFRGDVGRLRMNDDKLCRYSRCGALQEGWGMGCPADVHLSIVSSCTQDQMSRFKAGDVNIYIE